jgi:hypothetical protein
MDVQVHVIRANTLKQMENYLNEMFGSRPPQHDEGLALQEVEDAVVDVLEHRQPIELSPQPRQIRRLQHIYVERSGLVSESKGREPARRVVVFPRS